METLSPLLFSIRIGLFIMSGMLLLGAVIGAYGNAKTLSETHLGLGTDAGPSPNFRSEKRRAPRYKSDILLNLADDSGKPVRRAARLLNISQTGICFCSALLLRQGERIQGRLDLLSQGIFEISGRIVWQKPGGSLTLYGVSLDTFLCRVAP